MNLGDVARLGGISVRMLRHDDALGLLVPSSEEGVVAIAGAPYDGTPPDGLHVRELARRGRRDPCDAPRLDGHDRRLQQPVS